MMTRIIKNKYERPFEEFTYLQFDFQANDAIKCERPNDDCVLCVNNVVAHFDFQVIIQVAKKQLRPTTPPSTVRVAHE